MSAANAPKLPQPELQENFLQYARDLSQLITQGRSNESELRAASAQLGVYAADLRLLVQQGQRGVATLEKIYIELLDHLLIASVLREESALRHATATERYSVFFARALGMPQAEETRIARAARLHDVGKVLISDAVLSKRGALDAAERSALAAHASPGATLASALPSRDIQLIGDAIHAHHENWDGSGYPRGLAGDRIPLVARIVKLADVYDTLRDTRCYKAPLSHEEACRAILEGSAHARPEHFDPRLLDRLRDLQERLEALVSGEGSGGA
jgi:putative two-component system response regulator